MPAQTTLNLNHLRRGGKYLATTSAGVTVGEYPAPSATPPVWSSGVTRWRIRRSHGLAASSEPVVWRAPPLVLGGIVLNLADGVKEKTDVDLVTNDVKVALKLCEKNKSRNRSLTR